MTGDKLEILHELEWHNMVGIPRLGESAGSELGLLVITTYY